MASSRSIWPVFVRSHAAPVRTWAPPESAVRIEYSPALLREVSLAGEAEDAFGVLYGIRNDDTIRLVATRGRAGLEPLGVFASRVRGAVFLTEEDLERFEKAEASVAMVISGGAGGFFVRDDTGAIETIQCYEEFSIHEPAEPVESAVLKTRRWPWAACVALLPLLMMFYRPGPAPLALILHENEGQIKISWNVPITETLTILDGGERIYAPVRPGQMTATYARRTGDVTVGIGSAEARFLGPPIPPSEIEKARAGLKDLRAKIASLRAAGAEGEEKIAASEARIAALQGRLQ